jgi:zinc protease
VPALDVLGVILGDGESSRLQESLKNRKGIVNGIATYVFTPKEEGLFVIYANHSADDRDGVLREIDRELRGYRRRASKTGSLSRQRTCSGPTMSMTPKQRRAGPVR